MPNLVGTRRVEPLPTERHSFSWGTGSFDTGRRNLTREVEGVIAIPHHLVLVTIAGEARRLQVAADCGHRFEGADFPGAVSFVPANCSRRLRLSDVQATWASVSLRPDMLEAAAGSRRLDVPSFTNVRDGFIWSAVAEFVRLHEAHGQLDPAYCDAMALALGQYIVNRYGSPRAGEDGVRRPLAAWRLRRITAYVEANLDAPITVTDLARVAGLSNGHLHRALRETVGMTPLEFINQRRIERARQILATEGASIIDLSLRVGIASPSYFSRLFRRITGVNPSAYRNGVRVRAGGDTGKGLR